MRSDGVIGSCACGSESCQWCGIVPPPAPVVARYRCIPILPTSDEGDRLMAALMREAREAARLKRKAPRGTWSDE